jgi:Protein of unknown function (DUF3096)
MPSTTRLKSATGGDLASPGVSKLSPVFAPGDKSLRMAYARFRLSKRIGPPGPPYGEETMTLDPVVVSPLIALIAGILILLMPRLLNYVVAIYLIAIGIIGLAHHLQ